MRKIDDLIKRVKELVDSAPKKSYAMFWEEIEGIIQSKIFDYKIQYEQELPIEFLSDIFDTYIDAYIAVNYHRELKEMNNDLQLHLKLFNKGLAGRNPIPANVFFLEEEQWNSFYVNFNALKSKKHIPVIKYAKGCSFYDLMKSYKYQYSMFIDEPYERERLKKAWIFFRSYIFRVIPDNGIIYEEDIIDALKLLIDYELPKHRFDNEKVSSTKQYVSTFNNIFQTKIKLGEVGLSYQQLREQNPEKDSWLRTDEDEKALSDLRKLTHYYFDQLWNNQSEEVKSIMTRAEAYSWLASALLISKNQTHIATFNETMCAKTILEVFHYLNRE